MRAGGGTNHRMGLDDGILIKDNHIRLAGGIAAAVERMRRPRHDMPIEIEVQSLEQLDEALAAGATRILVDNFSIEELREVVKRARGRAKIEISGGVTLVAHGRTRRDRRRLGYDARRQASCCTATRCRLTKSTWLMVSR